MLTELGNVGYVESLHELGPNLRPETIPKHDADVVLIFFGYWFRRQQIAAAFANILSRLLIRGVELLITEKCTSLHCTLLSDTKSKFKKLV